MIEMGRRDALLRAMLEELVTKGYRELSIEEVLERTHVSREEFERCFRDKDECLFAAYDLMTDHLLEQAQEGCDRTDRWPDRVRRGLAAVLEEIAAEPVIARALTRSFPGIRPSAYQRYVELLSRFVPFMEEGREYSEVEEELPGEIELLAVGAAEAIIFAEVDAGRCEGLPAMLPEILFSVLVPFMGPDRAAEEMRSASAAL
jgi:AcrR family transcriptional regulator